MGRTKLPQFGSLGALAVTGILLLAATPAEGRFGSPRTIGRADTRPVIAVDQRGAAMVIAGRGEGGMQGLLSVERSPRGRFRRGRRVPSLGIPVGAALAPQGAVAVATVVDERASGPDVIGYAGGDFHILAVRRARGGPWDSTTLADRLDLERIRFVSNRRGEALVPFVTLGLLYVVPLPGRGGYPQPRRLQRRAADLDVVGAPDGRALLAWTDGARSPPDEVRIASIAGTGRPGPTRKVVRFKGTIREVRVGIDARGRALVAWIGCPRFDRCGVYARTRSPRGALDRIERVFRTTEELRNLALAVNGRGEAVLGWTAGPRRGRVHASVRPAGMRFQPAQVVGRSRASIGAPYHQNQLAIDAEGNSVFTWSTGSDADPSVRVAERPARRRFGRSRTLGRGTAPEFRFTGPGRGLVAWPDGRGRLRAASYAAPQ